MVNFIFVSQRIVDLLDHNHWNHSLTWSYFCTTMEIINSFDVGLFLPRKKNFLSSLSHEQWNYFCITKKITNSFIESLNYFCIAKKKYLFAGWGLFCCWTKKVFFVHFGSWRLILYQETSIKILKIDYPCFHGSF